MKPISPKTIHAVGVERPTWPFSAPTCRRGERTAAYRKFERVSCARLSGGSPVPPGLDWIALGFGLLLLTAALPVGAAVIHENFTTDPASRGWRAFGHTPLFQWSAAQQNLAVTWDSSHSNSFFALPLGTVLNMADDFSFAFDLRLADIRVGSTPNKPKEFQIAVGLLNSTNLAWTNYYAGTGVNARYGIRSAVEFNYFPDAGFGNTFSTIVASTNNNIYYAHNVGLQLTPGDTFRISLAYTASNQLLRTAATRNGAPFGLPPASTLRNLSMAGQTDFRVDTFAVVNYSDALQFGSPLYHGSILAHGVVDNVTLNLPSPPVANLRLTRVTGATELRFESRTNWNYRLERSLNLATWDAAGATIAGNGSTLLLRDNTPPATPAFYRIRAERP